MRVTPRLGSAVLAAAVFALLPSSSSAQSEEVIQRLQAQNESLGHRLDQLQRQIDDLMFFNRLGDLAEIDIVRLTGPPLRYEPNPTAQGAGNPFRFYSYVFIPRDLDRTRDQPLIVFPHGGVHSNFSSGATNVLRELLEQGYTVIAPEYRGSTGYGRGTYQAIDYGGLEIEDSYAARNFMLANYEFLDSDRVGIVGWSHGDRRQCRACALSDQPLAVLQGDAARIAGATAVKKDDVARIVGRGAVVGAEAVKGAV